MSYECTDDARHDSKTLFKGMALGAPALFLPWNGAGIPVVRDHGDAEEDGHEQYHGHRFYGMPGVAVGAASFAAPCDMRWWFQMVVGRSHSGRLRFVDMGRGFDAATQFGRICDLGFLGAWRAQRRTA